jgi:hypothetical protein
MKLKLRRRIIFAGKTRRTRRLVLVTLASLVALSETAQAQQVIAPPPPMVSFTPPAIADLGPGDMQVFPPSVANFLEELNPLQWGPVTLHPHVNYQFTYGTGVQSTTNQPASDTIIQSLSPGVLFVYGRHWTLDYTPTMTFYSNNHFQDNVSHSVNLTGGTTYDDWIFGLSQGFNYSSTPQVQTGGQTADTSVSTGLNASHQLTSKLALSLGVSQSLNYPSGFQSSETWSTSDALNYQFWPRLSAGITVGFGYTAATPDSYFGQLSGQTSWRATDKLSISANAGAQVTQFTSGGSSPLGNPIFGLSIQDQVFEHTQLSLNASEGMSTSYYQNQSSVTTSVGASINQRLFKEFNLSVGGSYNWNHYDSAATGVTANNSQEYYSVNVSLSTTFFKRVSASVFYSYSDSSTAQTGLSFSSSQVGFNLGYSY